MAVLDSDRTDPYSKDPSYNKVITVPNVISFIRLCLIPLFILLLMHGHNVASAIVFAVAAASDFVDGQVARRTHSVSRVGKILDPAIDTLLMVTGVLATFFIDRVPLWMVIIVFAREAFLLLGGAVLLRKFSIQVPVIYPGKVATTLLFLGFAAMLLYAPSFAGPGVVSASWLPGFNSDITSWGIYFIYIGIVLQIGVTIYYCVDAYRRLSAVLSSRADG